MNGGYVMTGVLEQIPYYVLLFAMFSTAGWIMEVVLKYIQYHRFINRGFLIGPYCPIYGWGAVLITLLADGVFFRKCTLVETFMVGFVACGALEYFVSWYMEKTSHARWWDYSGKPLNLNGRIWIGNLTLFGLAAVAIVYIADPPIFNLLGRMTSRARIITAIVYAAIIWTDRTVSHFLMRVVSDCIEHQEADNTEEIRQETRRMLRDRALLVRRIAQAYPELQPRPSKLVEKLRAAREEYKNADRKFKAQIKEYERAGEQRRRELGEAMRTRMEQTKAARREKLEKLREIENDLFGR